MEAHQVGSDRWTTLPDANGHTSTDTGSSCPYWLGIHPFLAHYQSAGADDAPCTPTGTTGAWNAATGSSDGYERWSVDLAPYAGQQVQVALSVITDDFLTYPGAYVDDVTGPGGAGSTSFESDGNTLDGWTVSGPPAGSPAATGAWRGDGDRPRPVGRGQRGGRAGQGTRGHRVPVRRARTVPVPPGRRDRRRRPGHRLRPGEPDAAHLQQGLLPGEGRGQRLGDRARAGPPVDRRQPGARALEGHLAQRGLRQLHGVALVREAGPRHGRRARSPSGPRSRPTTPSGSCRSATPDPTRCSTARSTSAGR